MRRLIGFLLLLAGLGMALPGFYLLSLGGSSYYLISGGILAVAALLVLRGDNGGVWLVWLVFLGTIVWSLREVGLDGWALMPRLAFLGVASLCVLLLLPRGGRAALTILGVVALLAAGAYALVGSETASPGAAPPMSATGKADGGWASYGNSPHGTRYSALAQITPANVQKLQQAWTYHASTDGHPAGGLEVTPLMVDGTLYGCTGSSSVFALDPVTGRQLWRHDAQIDHARAGHGVCRGVAFFRAPAEVKECPTRILAGTVDNRLIALDAKTGAPCRDFGDAGTVDLAQGLGKVPPGWTNPTSPPTIVNGIAVVGAFIVDNQAEHVPPGVVRGYDAVTGQLKWAFDPGRPDRRTPLAPGESYTPSTPNSWAVASADAALGLVYLPMGNGSPDFYGPQRTRETDRFSSAVVALDAQTGAVRWVFQAIHHDLWDYDLASQPVLVDFPTASGSVPALLQPTKTGQVFVLDRRDGHPLTKVEERPVPSSTIADERWSRTQPFSAGMPEFAGASLTEADMWGVTPFDQLYCRIRFRQARYQGIYTPLGLGYSVRLPGELGGIDWGSVAVDEHRGVMIVNSNRMADWDRLITRADADKEQLFARDGSRPGYQPHGAPGAAMAGTPYAVHWQAFLSGLGIPCQKPPYGYLTAVDLKSRSILWQRSIGDASNSGPFGVALHLPLPLGAPNIGGALVTGGGLVFIGATQDQQFRAVEESSGRTLWKMHLPAGGHATPMTFLGRDGRQYVVIAAGGNSSFGTGTGDSLMAWRLAP